MCLERMFRVYRSVAFKLTLWFAAFFSGAILIAFAIFHFLLIHGIRHVDLSPYSLHELLEVYRSFFGVSLALIGIISLLVGWFLARRALSGVEDVRQTALSIARGTFRSRVPVKGTEDEVDRLAIAFNEMLDQIEKVLCSMKEITDNIAHDLRSPITRMRGIAEVTLAGKRSVEEYERVIGQVIYECDSLLNIINTMLDISEAETGLSKLRMTELDIGKMANDVVDIFSPVAEDKQISVNIDLSGNLLLCADAQKIQRVLSNLLDNAIKYTPSGGSVNISVCGNEKEVQITIRDTGIGISEYELNHIFDRFYRGEKSRSEPGNGLGLSLARAFITAHSGTITAKSTPNEGSEFIVTLPKINVF